MSMSFEDFRACLLDPEARQSLGLTLTDAEAHQVYSDPQSSQSWFDYWNTINQPAAPPQPVATAAHDFPQAPPPAEVPAAYPTEPFPTEQFAPFGTAAMAGTGYPDTVAPSDPPKKKRIGLWVTLSILGALLLIVGIVVIVALTTARHWTKTDVAEKPETFYTETYETGEYDITDDGVSLCHVDQDWTECADAMEAQYNATCVDVDLTTFGELICSRHRTEIDRMRAEDQEGYIVASLGGLGHLTKTPVTATREVSNEDYEPAVTHEAVCYLGFIGECD